MDRRKKHSVPLETVKKSLEVLERVNTCPNLRISDLARSTGQSRGSVQRGLDTLVELGYVLKDEPSKKYRVANRVLNLSRGYGFGGLIADLSRDLVQGATQKICWPLVLTRPRGLDLEILATTQDQNPFAIQKLSFGDKIPFFESASSRVFLACNSKHVRNNYFEILSQIEPDHERVAVIKASVRQAKRQGYAFYQTHKDPEKAIAVPVVVGTNCYVCLVARFIGSALTETDAVKQLLPTLEATAADIGDEISRITPG